MKFGKNSSKHYIYLKRREYEYNLANFELRKHYMTEEQFFMESVLLELEYNLFECDEKDVFEYDFEIYGNQIYLFDEYNPDKIKESVFIDDASGTDENLLPENTKKYKKENKNTISSQRRAKIFRCNNSFCNKKYTSSYGLKYHLIHGHGSKTLKKYVCDETGCVKSFKNPNGLKYHQKFGHK
ncbi:hypothetical protein CWI37_0918p0010 [Hamiltosporidium tvaerminnensis]|uniref:C2H2-type domain-containing protein n=2 Tax=Hamiltosporidium TaxID=1176354 RepID=A0A4Q9L8E3_9MICR|nr:hypothetical protein CWI37_0918p0010 [Hamiltosporidium tvaerminnensis]TBU03201.1 hypothetical protein CWI36_0966p0010 [Hamiltosporidium magnivora]